MVEPGAKLAAETTVTNNIGIIATESTVKSGIYSKYLRSINKDITVVSKACPLFVPLVEEGLWEDRVTEDIVGRYLHEFKEYDIDALILGCTHYPLLRRTIGKEVGEKVRLVNPAYETAKSLKALLEEKKLLNQSNSKAVYNYYVSDGEEKFLSFADNVLPVPVNQVNVIDIESY